jgi:hypothetical protein
MKSYRQMTPKEWRECVRGLLITIACGLGLVLSFLIVFGKYLAE